MAQDDAELTHLDAQGRARMVDVGDKPVTDRVAVARAQLRMLPATLQRLTAGDTPKGDVLAVARVAGIQAAKRTPELIPLCHQIALTRCDVAFTPLPPDGLLVETRVQARDRTGAEMEALTAVSIAALTVYDMLKAIDRGMTLREVGLQHKSGGQRGDYDRDGDAL